jgi:hypothetical protein
MIAVAASLALLVLAGATIWFVQGALGNKDDGGNGNTAIGANGASGSAAPSSTAERRAPPNDHVWCDALGKEIFCRSTRTRR